MSSLNKDKARDKTKVHRAVATIKGKKKPRGLVGGVFVDTSNTTRVERESQVQSFKDTVQYSNSKFTKVNNSNSTVSTTIIKNLSDVIPDDGYTGFYLNKIKELGQERFVELANKARAGSDTPAKLFAWMLKNNDIVR